MKSYALCTPTTPELIEVYGEKHHISDFLLKLYTSPQEDSYAESKSLPIFAVADGVTLDFKKLLLTGRPYPDPSPSGAVAKLFCKEVVEQAEKLYEAFTKESIIEIFAAANEKVREHNDFIGEVIISGNITEKYAATGSCMVIRENTVYWMRICDAYFAHFNADMQLKQITSGSCDPYAVINGDPEMQQYIESGSSEIEPGDKLFLFTDGFQEHFKEPEFLDLFRTFDESLRTRIKDYSAKMNLIDPQRFGHEQTIIAVEA
ncbi:MAG: protein phosphatase 2C domain-containing protein [Candidatus Kaiserbacteria bacterium]|nr:protein phosphatase 2C domain-containing protein [Candidatus Kaiserbacteria bacterium]MCB9816748.1 protein phosphatase 2C domain-containing protein [Candidatus Nomurabacteria bacterium]